MLIRVRIDGQPGSAGKLRNELAAGRVHRTKTDIISPILFGTQRLFEVMSRNYRPSCRHPSSARAAATVAVILPEVDTICVQLPGQRQIVVDNKSRTKARAEAVSTRALPPDTARAPCLWRRYCSTETPPRRRLANPLDQIVSLVGYQIDTGNRWRLRRIIYNEAKWSDITHGSIP